MERPSETAAAEQSASVLIEPAPLASQLAPDVKLVKVSGDAGGGGDGGSDGGGIGGGGDGGSDGGSGGDGGVGACPGGHGGGGGAFTQQMHR